MKTQDTPTTGGWSPTRAAPKSSGLGVDAVVHEPLDTAGGVVNAESGVPGACHDRGATHQVIEDVIDVVLGGNLERTQQQGVESTVLVTRHRDALAPVNDIV